MSHDNGMDKKHFKKEASKDERIIFRYPSDRKAYLKSRGVNLSSVCSEALDKAFLELQGTKPVKRT